VRHVHIHPGAQGVVGILNSGKDGGGGGALKVIGAVTSALGVAGRKEQDPWHGAVSDAHPLDYVEAWDVGIGRLLHE
jgi:hypothetical protein